MTHIVYAVGQVIIGEELVKVQSCVVRAEKQQPRPKKFIISVVVLVMVSPEGFTMPFKHTFKSSAAFGA